MNDKLAQIEVSVNSLAKPIPISLLAARAIIKTAPEFKAIFIQARNKKWSSNILADTLFVHLSGQMEGDPSSIWETALYLADEFTQLGDLTLLVSTETGKALCKITEEDIYIPPPVLREDGRRVKALPRLRPELEGLIVQWQFDQSKEKNILQTLAKRVPSSELLVQEGDKRLLRATKAGRKQIVDMLRGELPNLLSPEYKPVSLPFKEFFRLCPICTVEFEVPDEFSLITTEKINAKIITPIIDLLAFNLRYDPYTVMQQQIRAQWTRSIARSITALVNNKREVVNVSILSSLPTSLWLADPNIAIAFKNKVVLPLSNVEPVLLHDWSVPVAYCCVNPTSYNCESRELLDRWEIVAECVFSLYLKPDSFSLYHFYDVPQSGLSIEII